MKKSPAYLLFSFLVILAVSLPASFAEAKSGARHHRTTPVLLETRHKFAPTDLSVEPKKTVAEAVIPEQCGVAPKYSAPQQARKEALADEQMRRRISSRSAILMNAQTGEVLYEQRPDLPGQPASTIKIITGLIAIQALNDPEMISVSRHAASMPRSKVYLQPGNTYRANDLINAVLLSSANDASVALAEKIAGSEPLFASLMTQKAKAWGATNTVCKTATGLTAPGQQTTVRDLAVLFNRAMENSEFASRVKQNTVRTDFGQVLKNHNRALWQIAGAEGGKTGFTNAARQTYVGKFKRGDEELLLAIMGSVTMWKDIKNLVGYGFTVMANNEHAPTTKTAKNFAPPELVTASGRILQASSDFPKTPVL
ncbi:MAG: D-alanyl-D-alanine carboxypeptidase [Desulfobulbaceae bacterium]|nr:D-alanyl-D-alanine carboxypeptidase [Desulfobulbaceae bacterium]